MLFRRALCHGTVRREAPVPVLLPAIGRFQFGRRPNVVLTVGELFVRARSACGQVLVLLLAVGGFQFGRRPNVLLVVGELFVPARSARSQARSACGIARCRRVSIWPKAERFACLQASSLSGREAPVLVPAVSGFQFGRRPNVLLAVGEFFVRARSARSQARSACVIARVRRVSIQPKCLLAVGKFNKKANIYFSS